MVRMGDVVSAGSGRAQNWMGRSGRIYVLTSEPVESFALGAGELHLLARGNVVLWVGSSEDLVLDPSSRARFRLALDCADRAFRVRDAIPQSERATIAWDLEIGQAMPISPVLRSAA